jgi:uncharacterized protein (TIGR02147 family)
MLRNIDIYQYEDYRHYLKDRFDRESSAPSFSWRKFSREAGIANPGYLNDVIKGRRRLSRQAAAKVVRCFSLLPHEADFLNLLIAFAHARKIQDKDRIYKKIVSRRSRSAFAQMNPALTRYYQDYRYPLVRCALMALDYKGKPSQIAGFLRPRLPASVVRRIIRDLCSWGVVKIDSCGKYSVTDKFITPSSKLGAQVRQMNRLWIRQAEEALETIGAEERYIASQLLCVSSALRDRIRNRIESFRSEIWDLVKNDRQKADCIMLLNTQFVPKSRKGK